MLRERPGFHDGAIQLVHTINGHASPRVPPIVVHTGDLVHLHMVNDTDEFHNWTTSDYDPTRQVVTRKCSRCGAQRERNSSGESESWKLQERRDSGFPPTYG